MNIEAESNLREWITQSCSAFDIVVCNSAQLPSDFKILDSTSIDQIWCDTFADQIGAFPVHKAQYAVQLVAHRVALRLAKLKTEQVNVSVNGLLNAWFHPVFAELATLIPIRQMARKLSAQNDNRPYAIPLKSCSFTALNSWSDNELEPLYLAYELRKKNVPVVLFIEDWDASAMRFELSKTWLPKGYPQIRRDKEFTTVMCKRAMRRAAFVSERSAAKRHHKPSIFTLQRYLGIDRDPAKLDVSLQPGPVFNELPTYSAPSDTPSLNQGFVQLMEPLTQKVAQWYRQELKNHPVRTAHVADHATFEGGLLAAEVTKSGGKVNIWPHSANLVHMHVHDPIDVARVTVAAQSTGAHWAKTFGKGKTSIDIRALLPKTSGAPPFDKNRPIHVILFAGAHALKRMPLLNYERHRKTWSRVLEDLEKSDVELTIKHKSSWETREWITGLAPMGAQLRFSNTRANKLNLPNMIFLSISHTSTAIFEGIARGIPGMTVRDVAIDETPYYDPEFVPRVPSEKAVEFISSLNSKTEMDRLRERQRIWFRRETSPNKSIGAPKY